MSEVFADDVQHAVAGGSRANVTSQVENVNPFISVIGFRNPPGGPEENADGVPYSLDDLHKAMKAHLHPIMVSLFPKFYDAYLILKCSRKNKNFL